MPCAFDPSQLIYKKELSQKNGFMWECVAIKPAPEDGKILTFKLRKDFNPYYSKKKFEINANNINQELYPAVEAKFSDSNISIKKLELFGYKKYTTGKNIYLDMPDRTALIKAFDTLKNEFPDRKALLKAFDKLKMKSPTKEVLKSVYKENSKSSLMAALEELINELPDKKNLQTSLTKLSLEFKDRDTTLKAFEEIIKSSNNKALLEAFEKLKIDFIDSGWPSFLNIADSYGTASDLKFTLEHFLNGLLDIEEQFCHDHHSHITPRLLRLLEGKRFYEESELSLVSTIYSMYRLIYLAQEENSCLKEKHKVLEFFLGMVTDLIFNRNIRCTCSKISLAEDAQSAIKYNFDNDVWKDYIAKRFPKKTPTGEEARELWEEVKESAYEFLAKKYQHEYKFRFDHLELNKQEVIKYNLLAFIRLSKLGLVIEDLYKVNISFVKWMANYPEKFRWLLSNGLTANQILDLRDDQRDFVIEQFDSLTKFINPVDLSKCFDLHPSPLKDSLFLKCYKILSNDVKNNLLKYFDLLLACYRIGINFNDILCRAGSKSLIADFLKVNKGQIEYMIERGIILPKSNKAYKVEYMQNYFQIVNKNLSFII